jgi:hypothetical protein
MGLKLSVVVVQILLFLWFFVSLEDDYSACVVPHSKKITSVIEFHHADQVFLLDLLGGPLVAEHLAEFVVWSFVHFSSSFNL